MKHYVLTRSAFGPAWDIAANARRLAVTKAVTARLMSRQTCSDWTWVVLLDERDPLLRDRMALYGDSAPAFAPIVHRPNDRPDRHSAIRSRQRAAAADYAAPWREAITADCKVLTTRIDDDDGFAPDALARFQAAAEGITERKALMLPVGFHLWAGRYSLVRHERNAMHTFVAPPGDDCYVYSYGHTTVAQFVGPENVRILGEEPGWLWIRHRDTISDARRPGKWGGRPMLITPALRAQFPIDWKALEAAWR
jgi:hypothetical protein